MNFQSGCSLNYPLNYPPKERYPSDLISLTIAAPAQCNAALGEFSTPFFEFNMPIKKFRSASLIAALLCTATLTACGAEQEKEVKPLNETVTLTSGQEYVITSPTDENYQASVSANGSVTIYWQGSPNCTETPVYVRNYGKTCRLPEGGKFVAQNDGPAPVTAAISVKAVD
jgi:hypothetical protein